MNDPTRWRDNPAGLSPGAEALLRGARRPHLPAGHDLERLGAAVDGIARAPARAPVSWLRLGVAAAAAFAIVGGTTFVWALHARDLKRREAGAVAARAHDGLEAAARSQPQPALAPVPVTTPARVAMAPAARPVRRHIAEPRVAPAAPVAAPAPTDALAREVPLIDEGRRALVTAPSRALAVLETHRREFPRGQLAAEREFLAVQALLQMNRMADAKKRAQELAGRYPSSSYAARAARLIDGNGDPGRVPMPPRDGARQAKPGDAPRDEAEAQRATSPAGDGSQRTERPGSQRSADRL